MNNKDPKPKTQAEESREQFVLAFSTRPALPREKVRNNTLKTSPDGVEMCVKLL